MNSVLQILLHCPPLARFFLADNHNRFECQSHRGSRDRTSPAAASSSDGGGGSEPGTNLSSRRACLACEMDLLVSQAFSGKRVAFSPHSFLHAMWTASERIAG